MTEEQEIVSVRETGKRKLHYVSNTFFPNCPLYHFTIKRGEDQKGSFEMMYFGHFKGLLYSSKQTLR